MPSAHFPLDVQLLVWGLVLLALFAPAFLFRRFLPKFGPAPDFAFPDVEAINRRYLSRALLRHGVLAAWIALSVYFWYRAVATSAFLTYDPTAALKENALALLAALLFGFVAAVAVLRRAVDKIVQERPDFNDISGPLSLQVKRILIIALIFVVAMLCVYVADTVFFYPVFLLSLATFVITRRALVKSAFRKPVAVASDSELGKELSAVVRTFGFEPKRLMVIKNAVANGLALPNGTVVVTSMLCHLVPPRGIASIVAHEASHAKDRDGRQFQILAMARFLIVYALCGASFVLMLSGGDNPLYSGVAAFCAVPLFDKIATTIVNRKRRKAEFKCDAAAARAGYGPSLAEALKTLHRANGSPAKYIGLDKLTRTHPSLNERVDAINAVVASLEQPSEA